MENKIINTDLSEGILELCGDVSNYQLPDPDLVNHYRMMNDRKLWLDFRVDATSIWLEKQIMLYNIEDADIPADQRKPIWIYLFNYGGDLHMCWSLIDIIDASKTPVYTVNVGQCASAAALIFMAGHKRFMFPNSVIVIHEGSASIEGDSTKVLDASESYKKILKRMKEYIIKRTRIPPSTVGRKRNNDWELGSEDCLKYGVCDSLVTSLSDVI